MTFNQAVENAERPGSYRITSEDIWNFRVPISQVELAQDGRTALLTTGEELYEGNYGVRLNKVTSRLTAANISDFGVETPFSVQDWPRDKGFYMARFRLPVLVLGTLLLVLVVLLFTGRSRDRSAERAAAMVAAIPPDERASLPPTLDITCHMCGRTWTVTTNP